MATHNTNSGVPPTYQSITRNPEHSSTTAAPPRYSVIYGDPQEIVPTGSQPTEHEFTLRSGAMMTGKPWLTLRMLTRPSKLPHKYPRIFGGENIAGAVEIKLDQPMHITSITLYLRGRMRSGFVDQVYPFLDVAHTIWTKDAGDPMHPGKKFDGKFSGELSFPFSFAFPTEVDTRPRTGGAKSRPDVVSAKMSTPQTFLESQIHANIDYELVLQVTHGILRSDSKLKTTVVYIPEVKPPPPSKNRQLAYISGARSLPGPGQDPQGWLQLPTVSAHGIIAERKVTLEYQLYLARPLSYTRGTAIPCYLALFSRDPGGLAVLADPKAQNVRLQRTITFFEDPSRGIEQVLLQGKEARTAEDILDVGVAIWWTPRRDDDSKGDSNDHIRWLEGEVHLEADLPPSSNFLPFKIEYSVQILRPDAALFQPSTWEEQAKVGLALNRALISHPVTIATLNADGPIPAPFTPKPRRPSLSTTRQHRTGGSVQTSAMYGIGFTLNS